MSQSTVAGILLIVFGLISGGKPRMIWQIAEKWKSRETNGPTDIILLITSVLGGVFIVTGILLLLGIIK